MKGVAKELKKKKKLKKKIRDKIAKETLNNLKNKTANFQSAHEFSYKIDKAEKKEKNDMEIEEKKNAENNKEKEEENADKKNKNNNFGTIINISDALKHIQYFLNHLFVLVHILYGHSLHNIVQYLLNASLCKI